MSDEGGWEIDFRHLADNRIVNAVMERMSSVRKPKLQKAVRAKTAADVTAILEALDRRDWVFVNASLKLCFPRSAAAKPKATHNQDGDEEEMEETVYAIQ